MKIEIEIPDQVWNEDPTYVRFFEGLQLMVNRMSVSHYKYGRVDDNAKLAEVDERANALQRISMYDPTAILQTLIWPDGKTTKPLGTGNTENLLDAANFLLLEYLFPKHAKAHFKSQTSKQSPGLVYAAELEKHNDE